MTSPKFPKCCFVVFSDDWGEHPSSCQHIFKHIAEDHKVLWVNTIGMRTPKFNLTDASKIAYKVKKMILGGQKRGEQNETPANITVCQPLMLPFINSYVIRKINRILVTSAVKKNLRKLNIKKPILVTTVPNACDFVGLLGEEKVVYYCVDDFTQWPGLEHNLVHKMEVKLAEKADVFVATSQILYDKFTAYGKPVHLLTHGVDLDLFSRVPAKEHSLLKAIPKPRVGYFGLFDERSDQSLLIEVAARLPDISFVITGQVEIDISRLKEIKNIHFTGKVPYAELPEIIRGLDILMLPYRINSQTESINPLKLKEYLASGKPVLSTPLPEAKKLDNYLNIVEDISQWEMNIKELLGHEIKKKSNKLMNFLEQESWQKKAKQFKKMSLSVS